jgi:hypothetical protein
MSVKRTFIWTISPLGVLCVRILQWAALPRA